MQKLSMTLAALMMTAGLVGVAGAGGQARVKVDSVPSRVEAGRPFQLAITVSPQWGGSRNIEPIVTAECGELKVAATAVALKRTNRYRATLNLPAAGQWTIRVESSYCHTVMSPVSVQAVAAATGPKQKGQG